MSPGQMGHTTGQMRRVPGTDGTHTRRCPAKILYVYWFFLSNNWFLIFFQMFVPFLAGLLRVPDLRPEKVWVPTKMPSFFLWIEGPDCSKNSWEGFGWFFAVFSGMTLHSATEKAFATSHLTLFQADFGKEFPSWTLFVERSILSLLLSKLCAVRFALQNRALFEGEKMAKRYREKGRKRGCEKRSATLFWFLSTTVLFRTLPHQRACCLFFIPKGWQPPLAIPDLAAMEELGP